MRILFLGDVVGRSGREALFHYLPSLRTTLSPDIVVVNGENAAAGFGITDKITQEFYAAGIDAITTGNHIWAQKELVFTIDKDPRLLRPLNFPEGTPGKGFAVVQDKQGRKILVVNLLGRLFMEPVLDDPFAAVQKLLGSYILGTTVQAIVVDMHAETTSEKMAMAHFLDGRVSGVVGTHSHVPTADAQILEKGTAYQSDAGMCGNYRSVIGMSADIAIARFTRKMPTERLTPTEGEATVCGVFIETNDRTGLATRVEPVRMGPWLTNTVPVMKG